MMMYAAKCKKVIEDDEEREESEITLEKVQDATTQMFVFSIIWAFGGSLSESWRLEFMNECVKSQLKKVLANPPAMWWEFYPEIDDEFVVTFTKWDNIIPKFIYNQNLSFFDLVVPTKDSVTFSWLMEKQVKCL